MKFLLTALILAGALLAMQFFYSREYATERATYLAENVAHLKKMQDTHAKAIQKEITDYEMEREALRVIYRQVITEDLERNKAEYFMWTVERKAVLKALDLDPAVVHSSE